MLGKKYVVQKSFRLDAKLESDLEKLSVILGRPQNELVNFALENLMQDNKIWFIHNAMADIAEDYFNCGAEDFEIKLANVYLKVTVQSDFSSLCHIEITHDDGDVEKFDKVYEDTPTSTVEMLEYFKDLGMYLHKESKEVQDFITQRLNYR